MSSSLSVAGSWATSTVASPGCSSQTQEKRIKRTTQMAFSVKDKEAGFALPGA